MPPLASLASGHGPSPKKNDGGKRKFCTVRVFVYKKIVAALLQGFAFQLCPS
jgi:hypothetical protein